MNKINKTFNALKDLFLPEAGKETTLKYFLSFIFLGGFGLHAFRVNQVAVGMLTLFAVLIGANAESFFVASLGYTDEAVGYGFFFKLPSYALYIYAAVKYEAWIKEFNDQAVETK